LRREGSAPVQGRRGESVATSTRRGGREGEETPSVFHSLAVREERA
jgi:hypothetical protein